MAQNTRRGSAGIQALCHQALLGLEAILEAMPDRTPGTRITMAARKLTAGLSRRRGRPGRPK